MDKALSVNGKQTNRSSSGIVKRETPSGLSRLQRERSQIATNNARKQMAERLPDAVRILLDALTHEHNPEHKHDCYWFQVRSAEMILKRFIPELQSIQATVQTVEQPNIVLRWEGLEAITAKGTEIKEAALVEPEAQNRHPA